MMLSFFLFLALLPCLSRGGTGDAGTRYVTSRQRRSEHDDDASTLTSSSPANWLHLRCLRASPSSSHPEFHQNSRNRRGAAATPIGHDHRGKSGTTALDWSATGDTGVAKPERRQTWPWNGCGAAFACERRFRRCYCCFCRRCCRWLAAVVTGNRLVVLPPPTPPPTPPPQPAVAACFSSSDTLSIPRRRGRREGRLPREMPQVSGNLYLSRPRSVFLLLLFLLPLSTCRAAPRRFHLAILSALLHLPLRLSFKVPFVVFFLHWPSDINVSRINIYG